MRTVNRSTLASIVLLILLLHLPSSSLAHGGVVLEDDKCVINIGFLQAHFTLYQPDTRGNEEFCEQLPTASHTIFAMDYLDDYLRQMPLEFRIIRDVTGFGRFANFQDIRSIPDLDDVTVFHEPPRTAADGALSVEYEFAESGPYIGIVTAEHPSQTEPYRAVFFFRVGGADWGYWPLFALLLVAVQLLYWQNNGTLGRWISQLREARS